MLINYCKIAWRNLTRHKLNSTIHILGLTLGLTACLVIFLLVRFELGYDRFHPGKDRIYRIVAILKTPQGTKSDIGFIAMPLPAALRKELTGFESVSSFTNFYTKVTVPDASGKTIKEFDEAKRGEENSDIVLAEPRYFDIFKYRWLAGNATALEQPFAVVLTESQARRYFDKAPTPRDWIGKRLIYHDSLTVTVSGIVEDWKGNTDFGFKDFISYSTFENSFLKHEIGPGSWNQWSYGAQGVVMLAKGNTPARAERQFPAFMKAHITGHLQASIALQPLSAIHFDETYRDSISRKANLPTLYSLIGIAIFILLIAAINFINLSTAQSVRRAREIGVRKVLGSGRTSLVWQFLSETALVVGAAVLLTLLVTQPLIASLHSLFPPGLGFHGNDTAALLFLGLTAGITCLLAGLYPARVLSSYKPVLSLKGQGVQQLNSRSWLRKGLIVFQFTVSLLFIIGSIVIGKQVHYILHKDLGFDTEAIVTLKTPRDRPQGNRAVLEEKIKQIPGVRLVTMHLQPPTAKSHSGTHIERKGAKDQQVDASYDMCDENYVPLFGLKLVAGRNLHPSDTIREFLLNETCAKELGFKSPEEALGSLVDCGIGGATGPIVGIIKDFHSKSLHEPITPFFLSSYKDWESNISLKFFTGDNDHTGRTANGTAMRASSEFPGEKSAAGSAPGGIGRILAETGKAWAAVYPDRKFEYSFLDDTIARLYEREQKTSRLMNIAMAMAIFISCMGLFGLAMFTAEQRTKEIGIRKVLGASVGGIVSMLSMDFLKLVLLAIVISSPIAWYFMHLWLQDFAYRITIGWWIYVVAGLCAIGIALFTVSFQAIRAAIANPVKSLRSE